jgi:hypothetical protein
MFLHTQHYRGFVETLCLLSGSEIPSIDETELPGKKNVIDIYYQNHSTRSTEIFGVFCKDFEGLDCRDHAKIKAIRLDRVADSFYVMKTLWNLG